MLALLQTVPRDAGTARESIGKKAVVHAQGSCMKNLALALDIWQKYQEIVKMNEEEVYKKTFECQYKLY